MKTLLNEAQRKNTIWLILKTHLAARIDTLRKKNDNPLSMDKTREIRGRIAELKRLLDEAEPKLIQTKPRNIQ